MQTKVFNAYRITHKNGSIEDINALDLVQALENMETPDTESKVIQAFLVKENVRTLVEDEPDEIIFSAIVAEGGTGSIATPASGKVHVGDQIALKAIPARTFTFVNWKLNGEVISTEADLVFTMPKLANLDTAMFVATFRLADVSWTANVLPNEASVAGSIAFPAHGTTEANKELELLAVPSEGYTFDHWERNGINISDSKLLKTEATPLNEKEESVVYTAVFTAR